MVFLTTVVRVPHFNRYRVRFRKVYSGKGTALDLLMGK